jgi:glycosyltransferase involved in cell wall biosynthesis
MRGSRATPAVSVVLPVRDGAAHLAEALDSLAAQTFADFEAIVVDDGSTDGSATIARARCRHDPRFRVLAQPALGLVAALERGRAEARGRYLARMDADDVALPARLELQVAALDADPSLAACGGQVAYFPAETVLDGARRYERWVNGLVTAELAARDVFVECPLPHPTLVVRRAVLGALGGYRDRGWPEDYDLVLRLYAAGHRFRNLEAPVLRWREHPRRLSRTDPRYGLDAFTRCKVAFLRETLLRGRPGVLLYGAGPVGKSFARELGRQDVPVVAFVEVDARKIGKRIHGAPVVGVDGAAVFGDALALGAVSGAEARERVRALARAQGRREGRDFAAVA